MIIRRVELENFISHRQSRVDFDTGITVIVGPNGAGKTSIIDAITYGLFKEHTRGNRIANLVNRERTWARVRVWFIVNGVEYMVERNIIRTSNDSAQTETFLKKKSGDQWILVARGDRTVNNEIEKILGVSRKTYMLSVFVKQGEIEKFVTATPSERKEALAELLGLTRMERAYEKMKDVINEWNSIYITVSHEASRAKYLEEELRRTEEKKKALEEKLYKLKVEEAKTIDALEKLKEKFSELEEKREQARELNNRARILRRELEWFRKEKERLEKEVKEALEAANRLESIEAKYRKLIVVEDGVEALRRLKSLGDVKSMIEEKRGKLEELLKKLVDVEDKARRYLELSTSVKALEESLRMLRKRLLEFNELKTRLEENTQRLENLKQRVMRIASKYMLSHLPPEKLLERLEEFLKELKDKKSTNTEIYNSIEAEIKTKQHQLNEVLKRIENIKSISGDRCPICSQPLSASLRQRLLNLYEDEKKKLEERIRELEEEKKNIKDILSKIDAELEKVQKDYIDLTRIINELKDLERIVEALREKVKLGEEEYQEYKRVEERYEEERKKLEELERYYQEKLRLEAEKKSLEEKLRELNEKLEEAMRLEEIIRRVEEKLGQPRSVFDKLREELHTLRIEMGRLQEKASKLGQRRKEYDHVVKKLGERENNLKVIEEKLRELSYSEEEYIKTKGLVEKLREQLASLQKEIAGIEGSLRELNDIIEKRRSEREKARKALKEKERVEKYIRLLNNIRKLFGKDGLQKIIRAQAKNLIEYYLKDIISKFNLEFSDVTLDDDFNITVSTPQGEQPVESISGGERVALAIALRLALARALVGAGVESIILDEPTIHLDEERRRELVRILRASIEKTQQILPQLIIVTHDRELEDAADTVYMVTRSEGYSKVSRLV